MAVSRASTNGRCLAGKSASRSSVLFSPASAASTSNASMPVHAGFKRLATGRLAVEAERARYLKAAPILGTPGSGLA